MDDMFGHSSENVIGYIGNEGSSPFLAGGKVVDGKYYITDLRIKCPYYTVSDGIELESQFAEMTPEQIEKFNHRSSPIKVGKHSYTYAEVDGDHSREVYDFMINNEQYHLKDDELSDGGWYTVVWKGDNEDRPDEAVAFVSSDSQWEQDQIGIVDTNQIIDFINQNPNRFSRFIDQHASENYYWKHFQTGEMIMEIMKMETESELAKESAVQYPDETFLTEVVQRATAREELNQSTTKAEELLREYEQLAAGKNGQNSEIADD